MSDAPTVNTRAVSMFTAVLVIVAIPLSYLAWRMAATPLGYTSHDELATIGGASKALYFAIWPWSLFIAIVTISRAGRHRNAWMVALLGIVVSALLLAASVAVMQPRELIGG